MVKRRTRSGYQISNRPFPVFSLAGEYKGNGRIFIKLEPCPICKNRHKKDLIYGERDKQIYYNRNTYHVKCRNKLLDSGIKITTENRFDQIDS